MYILGYLVFTGRFFVHVSWRHRLIGYFVAYYCSSFLGDYDPADFNGKVGL